MVEGLRSTINGSKKVEKMQGALAGSLTELRYIYLCNRKHFW